MFSNPGEGADARPSKRIHAPVAELRWASGRYLQPVQVPGRADRDEIPTICYK